MLLLLPWHRQCRAVEQRRPGQIAPQPHLGVQQEQQVEVAALLLCPLGGAVPLIHHHSLGRDLGARQGRRQQRPRSCAHSCSCLPWAASAHGSQELAVGHHICISPVEQGARGTNGISAEPVWGT